MSRVKRSPDGFSTMIPLRYGFYMSLTGLLNREVLTLELFPVVHCRGQSGRRRHQHVFSTPFYPSLMFAYIAEVLHPLAPYHGSLRMLSSTLATVRDEDPGSIFFRPVAPH